MTLNNEVTQKRKIEKKCGINIYGEGRVRARTTLGGGAHEQIRKNG